MVIWESARSAPAQTRWIGEKRNWRKFAPTTEREQNFHIVVLGIPKGHASGGRYILNERRLIARRRDVIARLLSAAKCVGNQGYVLSDITLIMGCRS